MFQGLDHTRVVTMTDRERRWLDNIKKAIFEADTAYLEGKPEDRCFEELCKAIDTAKTLRRSLLGEKPTNSNNKKFFIEFLDFELPGQNAGGLNLTLFDGRKGEPVRYSFSSLTYAIRCMIHENENLNAAEQPDFHVLLDWTMSEHDQCGGVLDNGTITLNARWAWLRIREIVTKFVWGLEAMIAITNAKSFSMSRDLCSIRPGISCNQWADK